MSTKLCAQCREATTDAEWLFLRLTLKCLLTNVSGARRSLGHMLGFGAHVNLRGLVSVPTEAPTSLNCVFVRSL